MSRSSSGVPSRKWCAGRILSSPLCASPPPIRKSGDRVVVWLASANRDEAVFPDADTFDVTRSPNPHIGFGFGPHTCLGGPLAKLELRIALEELLKRYEGFEVVGQPERTQANFVGGLKRFPLRLIGRKSRSAGAMV